MTTRLKILCLVSGRPGHIDFGGLGFIKLARALADRGHEVTWLCPETQRERLATAGFLVDTRMPVEGLALGQLVTHQNTDRSLAFELPASALRRFQHRFQEDRPDLLLCDRVLTLAPLLAENLDLPLAVVGTSGEILQRSGSELVEALQPVPEYQRIGEALKRKLGWRRGEIGGYWGRSSTANITFLGRSFYARTRGTNPAKCWTVCHWDAPRETSRGPIHGISFGHSGDLARLITVADALISHAPDPRAFRVFCGSRDRVHEHYTRRLDPLQVCGWVPFDRAFAGLRTLTYFGGIGTLWHAVNHHVPMLVVPGNVGDQQINGERVSVLGLGACLEPGPALGVRAVAAWNTIQHADFIQSLARFRDRRNYSHSMATAADGIESLADSR
jgi:hypothetical protein